MKSLYTILLFSIYSFQFTATKAQSVRVFSKTGLLKGTYSTVAAALATTTDGDSLILSAHTFNESRLKGNYSVVYQGTISGGDTTTIDAKGNGSVFDRCRGTIRDIVLTGANYSSGSGGAAIQDFEGKLTGNTTIRNNEGFNTAGIKGRNIIIEGNVKFLNNKHVAIAGGNRAGAIHCSNGNLTIKDDVLISGNEADSGAIVFFGANGYLSKIYKFTIEGNVTITKNKGKLSNAIWVGNGCIVSINNANIYSNIAMNTNTASIYSRTTTPALPYDSIGMPEITIKNSRIYNPKPDGTRQNEVIIKYVDKPVKFHTEGCWWGNSDTTGLIIAEAGTDFTMPNWAVAKWYGVPFGTSGSQVRAQMLLNTGAALPANCFKGLEGKFTATAGSFPSPTTVINAGNLIASDYYYPASGPFAITASVDAGTFRANNKGALGIKEPGYTSVKVFPNPATHELHISNLPAGITLHVFDASGRIALQRGYLDAQPELVIPVADWPAGVYTINLYNQQDQLGTAKFVKK